MKFPRLKRFLYPFLLLFFCVTNVNAQNSRVMVAINDNWKFFKGDPEYASTPDFDDTKWDRVNLPHTWNAKDPFDDDQTYFRGIGWYRKTFHLNQALKNKKVFLLFEGAYQVTDIYVNGDFAGEHKGGFTAFSFDITPYLNEGPGAENVIAVQVNSAHNNFIPPLSVGYALYGGIYRKTWLIATNDLHFTQINNNAKGVFVSTPTVNEKKASLIVRTSIVNQSGEKKTFQFVNTISDKEGNKVKSFSKEIFLDAGNKISIADSTNDISNPHLWSPENPYLYNVKTQLIEDGKVIDEVSNHVGFRWFHFDPQNGFFLNGKKYLLHGTNRHQDLEGKGDALSDEDHIRDMHIIKIMGANFVRLAHYPQAPEILELADELGILIWEEIPVVDYMTIHADFLGNAENMLREMIQQNYNHPSIIIWGSMNEILLQSQYGVRIQRHVDDSAYVHEIRKYAVKLDSTIRSEDPSRYTTMAMHGSGDYRKYNLDNISQIKGRNIYDGWYGGKVDGFGKYLDKLHKEKPDQIIFISEYGAGSDRQLNTSDLQRLDFTGGYQRYYHESYLRQINERPYLGGTAIWNEFDFSQPNIGGPMSNLNNKGMLTWDRKYKDVYFLYKANWNPMPMVYIATRDWLYRAGYDDTKHNVDIYANTGEVTFYVNGNKIGTAKPDDVHKCTFTIQLKDGDNFMEAVGKEGKKIIKDAVVIHNKIYPHTLSGSKSFSSFYINIGSNAQYTDDDNMVWMQDQPYSKGSYGYLSGKPTNMNLKYMIRNTLHTPLLYSYLDGVKNYRIDVPDGIYQIDLYFIEPEKIQKGERVFNVSINKQKVISHLDLASEFGFCIADKKAFVIKVENGEGLQISLDGLKGNPVLSGIKMLKQ